MKVSDLRISWLETEEDHEDAIESISRDSRNSMGDWESGYCTTLLPKAVAAIDKIRLRMEKRQPGWCKADPNTDCESCSEPLENCPYFKNQHLV